MLRRPHARYLLTLVLLATVAGVVFALWRNGHSPSSLMKLVWSPVPHEQILHASPFRFSIADRNWETGLSDEFTVNERGHVEYAFEAGRDRIILDGGHEAFQSYRKIATFELSRDELGSLRRTIADERFFALDDRYVDEDVADGTSVSYTVQVGSTTKRVYCSNASTPAIIAISRFVHERLLAAHRDALAHAPREVRNAPNDAAPTS